MKKKIGLLGGISSASTIEYYQTLNRLYYDRFQNYYYPEIIINSLDFQYFTDLEDQNCTEEYIQYIVKGIKELVRGGADFAAMAANSPHSVLDAVREQVNIPLVSIVEAVGREAHTHSMKKVLLTGIRYTMAHRFYPVELAQWGIETLVPGEADQHHINEMIFGNLARNIITDEDRKRFKAIIEGFEVDGVILGCTELPLLLDQRDTKHLLLNSLSLHCHRILDFALEKF